MDLLLVAALDIVGLVAAALFLIGVPVAVALLAYDLIDSHQRAVDASAASTIVTPEPMRRVVPSTPSRRLTA